MAPRSVRTSAVGPAESLHYLGYEYALLNQEELGTMDYAWSKQYGTIYKRPGCFSVSSAYSCRRRILTSPRKTWSWSRTHSDSNTSCTRRDIGIPVRRRSTSRSLSCLVGVSCGLKVNATCFLFLRLSYRPQAIDMQGTEKHSAHLSHGPSPNFACPSSRG